MTRDDIIQWAREAARQPDRVFAPDEVEFLLTLASLVAAAERDACASIVENANTPDCGGWTAIGIADSIRARKDSA